MTKREFRSLPPSKDAAYPTLDEFDRQSRRSFLARLAGAALGAGALAALGGCDGRPVGVSPDGGITPQPPPPIPPPPRPTDGRVPEPDEWTLSGGARAEDSRVEDWERSKPDAKQLEGDVAGPDARIDDPSPGFAPTMDARIDDSGTCPNP